MVIVVMVVLLALFREFSVLVVYVSSVYHRKLISPLGCHMFIHRAAGIRSIFQWGLTLRPWYRWPFSDKR